MKKLLSFILLSALIVGMLGVTPVTRAATATTSLATIMSADTFGFMEIRTSDLLTTINSGQDLLHKANIPSDILQTVDQALTQGLKRPASVQNDILSWLGDSVGVGFTIPDAEINALLTNKPYSPTSPQPEADFVAAVKDEAALDAFFKDMLASDPSTSSFTVKKDNIGGVPAVVYYDKTSQPVLARWKGYIAVGTPSLTNLLTSLKNKKPTLASNPLYQKIVGMLKPNRLATIYSRTPLTPPGLIVVLALLGPSIGNVFGPQAVATPTPTPTPTPVPEAIPFANTLKTLGATGIGVYLDQKAITTEFAFYIDPNGLKQTFSILKIPATVQLQTPAKSISLDIAGQLSNKAIAVFVGSNMAQIYRNGFLLTEAAVKALSIMTGDPDQFDKSYAQLTSMLTLYGIDLDQDVLSWLGSDFAFYATYDGKSSPTNPTAFNGGLVVKTSDVQKTQGFLTKLNTGLAQAGGTSPTSRPDGLFTIKPPTSGGSSSSGPSIGYGLLKDTFLVNVGEDLTSVANAANGDGILASDAAWKDATALLPKSYQQVGYVNLDVIGALGQQLVPTATTSDKQLIEVVNLFKSAVLYGTDLGGGSSITTLTLTLK